MLFVYSVFAVLMRHFQYIPYTAFAENLLYGIVIMFVKRHCSRISFTALLENVSYIRYRAC